MKKKILSLVLAVLMISVLIPMAAFADSNEAEINGTPYATLQAAVNAANDGETVKLLNNVTLNDKFIKVTKGITIDFGEFTLNGVNDNTYPQALLQVNAPGKTVTLKGTTGGIDAKADTYGTRAIAIETNSKLVIEGGVYSSMNNCTIYADNAGTELVMNGGAINTNFTKVGNYKQSVVIKGDLTIKDVTIKNEATNAAGNVIDEKANDAKVSIIDSKIDAKNITAVVAATSTSTVEIKGTEVTTTSAALVNGGNITVGEGTDFESTSGRVISGATSAKIEGGSFKTSNAFGYSSFKLDVEGGSFDVEQLTTNANSTNLKISGGEFEIANETNAKQVLKYVAPTEEGGKVQVEINETAYTVNEEGEPEVLVVVAKIGDAEFYSFAEAAAAAKSDDVIEIVANEIDLTGMKNGLTVVGLVDESGAPATTVTKIDNNYKDAVLKNLVFATTQSGSKQIYGASFNNTLFENCKFTGNNGLRYCYANGDVTFKNCSFDTRIYGAHFDGGNGNVTFDGCKISGFNTFYKSLASLTFTNCEFTKTANNPYCVCQTHGTMAIVGESTFSEAWATPGDYTYVGTALPTAVVTIGKDVTVENGTVLGMLGEQDGIAAVAAAMDESGKYTSGQFIGTKESVQALAADGMAVVYNEAGYFELVDAVAQIGTVGYATLAEAVAEGAAGDTVVLLADCAEDITLPVDVIFDASDASYTGTVSAPDDAHAIKEDSGVYTVITMGEAVETAIPEAKAALEALKSDYASDEAKAVIEKAIKDLDDATTLAEIESIVENAKADAAKCDEELAEAKAAAVATFKAYVEDLGVADTSFAAERIDAINNAANKAKVAEELAAAKAAADAQKAAEEAAAAKALQDAKDAAIAELKAVVGSSTDKDVLAMLASYIEQIEKATSISAVNSIVPGATSALKQQIEIANEGWLISTIRSFVNFTERGDQAQVKKVMGIIKPILGFFGIH